MRRWRVFGRTQSHRTQTNGNSRWRAAVFTRDYPPVEKFPFRFLVERQQILGPVVLPTFRLFIDFLLVSVDVHLWKPPFPFLLAVRERESQGEGEYCGNQVNWISLSFGHTLRLCSCSYSPFIPSECFTGEWKEKILDRGNFLISGLVLKN